MTENFHMLSLWLDNRRLVELGKMLHLPLRRVELEYLTHCALGEVFQDNAPRTFWAQRGASSDRYMRVLAYSELSLESLQEISRAFASPAVFSIVDWERSASKPMPAHFPAGMRLGFEFRLCPVVRLSSDCESDDGRTYKAGSELDAYQASQIRGDRESSRASVYRAWLERRIGEEQGARIDAIELEQFSLERMLRRSQGSPRKSNVITRPVIEVSGELEVLDSDKFMSLLERGVGRHRGFGFGMLRIRRASSR